MARAVANETGAFFFLINGKKLDDCMFLYVSMSTNLYYIEKDCLQVL